MTFTPAGLTPEKTWRTALSLPDGVHSLEHEQDPVLVLGPEQFLKVLETFVERACLLLGLGL